MKRNVIKIIAGAIVLVAVYSSIWFVGYKKFDQYTSGMEKTGPGKYRQKYGSYEHSLNKPSYPSFTGNYTISDDTFDSVTIYRNSLTGKNEYAAFLEKSGIEGEISLNDDGTLNNADELSKSSLDEYKVKKEEIKAMIHIAEKRLERQR